ncbi:MAG: N-6 DNA methylase [Promethearchaeota archaeon]
MLPLESQTILKNCCDLVSQLLSSVFSRELSTQEKQSVYPIVSLFVLVEALFQQQLIHYHPKTLHDLKSIFRPVNSHILAFLKLLDTLPKECYQKLFCQLANVPIRRETNDFLADLYAQQLFHSPEKRMSQGIIYTPKVIRQYMVEKSLDYLYKSDRPPNSGFTLLDPACGTGGFLIDVYERLQTERSSHSFISHQVSNLFGLDIDSNALVLTFSCLALRNVLDYGTLFTYSLFNCNALDKSKWPITNSQTFDLIIGNPPFVMGDNIPRKFRDYLKNNYSEIYQAEADLSYYFLQRGIQLLSPTGFLNFVFPRYLFKAHYASNIRKKILKQCIISEILDFNRLDPFRGIGSRTCILFLMKSSTPGKHKNNLIKINSVVSQNLADLPEILNSQNSSPHLLNSFYISQEDLDESPWLLINQKEAEFFQSMKKNRPTLRTLGYKVGRGGITGHPVFTVTQAAINEHFLEKEVLYKITKNSEIKRFSLTHTQEKYVLFLEKIDSYTNLKKYPHTFKYLKSYISELALRKEFQPRNSSLTRQGNTLLKEILTHSLSNNLLSVETLKNKVAAIPNLTLENLLLLPCGIKKQNGHIKIDYESEAFHEFWQWWKWTRPQNIQLFRSKKIVCPYISPYNRFAYDDQSTFNDTSDVLAIAINPRKMKESNYSLKFLLGCLNSLPANLFYTLRAKKKDYRYEYYPFSILDIPLPRIPNDLSAEEVHRIETLAFELGKAWTSYYKTTDSINQFLKTEYPPKASMCTYQEFFNVVITSSHLPKIEDPSKMILSIVPYLNERVVLYGSYNSDFHSISKIEIYSSFPKSNECLFTLFNWFLTNYQKTRHLKWRNYPQIDQIIRNMKLFPLCPASSSKRVFLKQFFNSFQCKLQESLTTPFAELTKRIVELEKEMHQLILKGYCLSLKSDLFIKLADALFLPLNFLHT